MRHYAQFLDEVKSDPDTAHELFKLGNPSFFLLLCLVLSTRLYLHFIWVLPVCLLYITAEDTEQETSTNHVFGREMDV